MKRILRKAGAVLAGCWALIPAAAQAAGGKAGELVVVADTRVIDSKIMRYFSDLYNNDMLTFAIWAVVLTAAYGGFLGWIMDILMSRTGLDLKSRKIVEH